MGEESGSQGWVADKAYNRKLDFDDFDEKGRPREAWVSDLMILQILPVSGPVDFIYTVH